VHRQQQPSQGNASSRTDIWSRCQTVRPTFSVSTRPASCNTLKCADIVGFETTNDPRARRPTSAGRAAAAARGGGSGRTAP
jgi:hypothetical protein